MPRLNVQMVRRRIKSKIGEIFTVLMCVAFLVLVFSTNAFSGGKKMPPHRKVVVVVHHVVKIKVIKKAKPPATSTVLHAPFFQKNVLAGSNIQFCVRVRASRNQSVVTLNAAEGKWYFPEGSWIWMANDQHQLNWLVTEGVHKLCTRYTAPQYTGQDDRVHVLIGTSDYPLIIPIRPQPIPSKKE